MAEGGVSAEIGVSQAQLKRELVQLGKILFNIDLQIQQLKQGHGNQQQIRRLEAAKLEIQKQTVAKEFERQRLRIQGRTRQC